MKSPKTLQEAIQFFSNYDNCREFMVSIRWADGKVRCPQCGAEKITYLENARLYRCYGDHPKQKFSLKVGTIFEDSPIPLEKWLPAVWMIVNCRNGVSSYEIHRAIGVTQKSAWFMLHRIRLAMQSGTFSKFGGPGNVIEADEAFIGGKVKNMHPDRQKKFRQLRDSTIGNVGHFGKTAVMGILDREQRKVRATVVPQVNRKALQAEILNHVAHGSQIYTDEAALYKAVPPEYTHAFVDHMEKYVDGQVHTNGLENFWSLLKRGLNGTYIAVEPFHLFRYVDEQVFRYNNRKGVSGKKLNDGERFSQALSQIVGKRLTYAEVTGKDGQIQAF
jgi:transposase-like protein